MLKENIISHHRQLTSPRCTRRSYFCFSLLICIFSDTVNRVGQVRSGHTYYESSQKATEHLHRHYSSSSSLFSKWICINGRNKSWLCQNETSSFESRTIVRIVYITNKYLTFGFINLESLDLPGKSKSKVKLSRNRPWKPIGLRGVKDPTLSRQSSHRWR
jgi:hypothetical protein